MSADAEQVAPGRDATCAEALDLFSDGLGGFAGGLGFAFGALGGVYLCGDVPPRRGTASTPIPTGAASRPGGRFGEYRRGVAACLVLHEQPGLLGLSRDPGTYAADP